MITRSLENFVFDSKYGRQMRFIAGPRQCGKTTLAKEHLIKNQDFHLYYNWDARDLRKRYRENPYFFVSDAGVNQKEKPWVCFDEIHKMPKWKNILKDFFDHYENQFQFIITGSARLDFFRKSGDSLAGRYFLFHLFPLTLRETLQNLNNEVRFYGDAQELIENQISKSNDEKAKTSLEKLLTYSGFPEPFLNGTEEFHRLWQEAYIDRLVREDLRDLTKIQDLENVATLIPYLSKTVGSALSVNSLREDLEVSHTAMRNYIKALRLCYIIFLVTPYSKRIQNTVKKEPKAYFFDWTRVQNEAARFENYVACELNALIHLYNDSGASKMSLHYIKTKQHKETDFLILKNDEPWLLVEVKSSSEKIDAHHKNQAKTLGNIPFIQIVKEPNVSKVLGPKTYVISADRFFS